MRIPSSGSPLLLRQLLNPLGDPPKSNKTWSARNFRLVVADFDGHVWEERLVGKGPTSVIDEIKALVMPGLMPGLCYHTNAGSDALSTWGVREPREDLVARRTVGPRTR